MGRSEAGRRVITGGVKNSSGLITHSGKGLVVKNAELANLIDTKFSEIAKVKPVTMGNLPMQSPPVERNAVTRGSEVASSDGVSPSWFVHIAVSL
jgi:hypothetical protein